MAGSFSPSNLTVGIHQRLFLALSCPRGASCSSSRGAEAAGRGGGKGFHTVNDGTDDLMDAAGASLGGGESLLESRGNGRLEGGERGALEGWAEGRRPGSPSNTTVREGASVESPIGVDMRQSRATEHGVPVEHCDGCGWGWRGEMAWVDKW